MIMDKKTCRDCKQFIQHYGLFEGTIRDVYCGHCVQNYTKRKRPDDPACQNFVPGEPLDEKMVSKEYLTKKLLQRILDMELWPLKQTDDMQCG